MVSTVLFLEAECDFWGIKAITS